MDLREECLGAKKIGISGHIRPDGDCVGVCLSLQMYLRKLLPEAEVTVYLQKPSEEFSYLKGYDEIQTECPVQEPFDVYLRWIAVGIVWEMRRRISRMRKRRSTLIITSAIPVAVM